MANTVTTRYLMKNIPKKEVLLYVTVDSDGTEESDLVVYDSSAVATILGIADPLTCTIKDLEVVVMGAAAARARLEFDANTDVLAAAVPVNGHLKTCYRHFGGLKNNASTGITGDILLTTLGLEAGDAVTILMTVRAD